MKPEAIKGLQCYQCKWFVPADPFSYTCPKCGNNLDYIYDYEVITTDFSKSHLQSDPERSIWRYDFLLPVKERPENTSLGVGNTPLVSLPRLARDHKLNRLLIKDDSRNPSGSLKDRATEIALQHASEQNKQVIVGASTGNAGSSLAALSAHHGVESVIFTPATAPAAKLIQILQHGAQLVPVNANYDIAFELAFDWAQKRNHYCRNTGINPILAEGKKTVALEIAEENGWQVPDHIFIPVGDGCIIAGVFKGFFDLLGLGWIDAMPALHGVQAEGSAAIVNSLTRGGEITSVSASTIADSISVDLPRDGGKARRAILESGGQGFLVSDMDILQAQKSLSENTGLFAEPAAAAAYAGFLQAAAQQVIREDDTVVILNTGSGLKDTASAETLLEKIQPVEANLEIIDGFLKAGEG